MDPTFSISLPSELTPYATAMPSYLSPLAVVLDRFASWRTELNLPEPGKTEDLGREVKMTHLTNYTFDGARADLSKTLSQSPAFQVSHNFAMGSQGGPMGGIAPGSYSFSAVYANSQTFMQGMIDNEGGITGRYNYGWSPTNTSKVSVQLAPTSASPSMISLEHDRTGKDYSLNFKSYNPSPVDLTGTYLASYLQSITAHLALGVEAVLQRPTPDIEEASLGYMAKYHSIKRGEDGQPGKDSFIATAQLLTQGVWQATYWQKLADRIDAGVDLIVVPAPNPRERKAIATVGLKYDFRMASFRGQVDSTGKVSALLEQRLSPAFAFLVAGEMDHFKNTSKFGVGIMVESADPELMEAQQQAAQVVA